MIMNYANYKTKIVKKYKIEIVGWPLSIAKASPRDLTDIDSISTLYEAWKTGAAYWVKLSPREYMEFMTKYDSDVSKGIEVEPGRQRRSDAGTSRVKSTKRQRATKDVSQAGPSKQQRKGQYL
jgi:hypothetical protein